MEGGMLVMQSRTGGRSETFGASRYVASRRVDTDLLEPPHSFAIENHNDLNPPAVTVRASHNAATTHTKMKYYFQ